MNVLLACKEANVKRILHYSSSEVYGTARYSPMDENHPTIPHSTYAVSKLAAEGLCFTLFHEHDIPVIILRQFNTYGPRETQTYIVPELIAQLSKTNAIKLGNVKARRDLTYVEDAAKGAIALMKVNRAVGDKTNIGFGKDWSIEELAHKTAELMDVKELNIMIEKQRLRPLDVNKLCCDNSKIHRLTGWKPNIDLREGLKRTIDWFRENKCTWIWERKIAQENKIWRMDAK
jgi:nucleoside-diphosphate-sugar epimerase